MEALILLLIGVIAIPILLIISHSSKKRTAQQPKGEPGSKITVKSPGVPRLSCPRCGSPVMLRGSRWECGWCLDSGELGSLSCTQAQTELHARIICRVDFVRTWADLKAELERLVPQHASVLMSALRQAAVYQISISPMPDDEGIEPTRLRDMRAFFEEDEAFSPSESIAQRIGQGEILFEQEGALSEHRFGTFWQSLLGALEEEGAIPWDTDTDHFFYDFACFACWRTGGPCADPAFMDRKYALLRAFHDRWEALHPEDLYRSEK